MAANTDRELTISRRIAAPRPLVFKAWTDPRHAAHWWGPQGHTTIACEMDVRVGGRFRVGTHSASGSEHWKVGTYREIVEPERIVFTFAWEQPDGSTGHELLTTVTLAEEGDGTRLTLHQAVFETAEWCDSHRQGWTSTLQRLADLLAETSLHA